VFLWLSMAAFLHCQVRSDVACFRVRARQIGTKLLQSWLFFKPDPLERVPGLNWAGNRPKTARSKIMIFVLS
jgi:hypothetical protein